eukprot:2139158-Rhodomonas_salina.1
MSGTEAEDIATTVYAMSGTELGCTQGCAVLRKGMPLLEARSTELGYGADARAAAGLLGDVSQAPGTLDPRP